MFGSSPLQSRKDIPAMIPSLDPTPARPSLALRIGITGSRKLRTDQLARIHGEIQDALASAKQQMERLSHEPTVSPFYDHEADGRANATLHMISPLARDHRTAKP